jgi:hypothetical protein
LNELPAALWRDSTAQDKNPRRDPEASPLATFVPPRCGEKTRAGVNVRFDPWLR